MAKKSLFFDSFCGYLVAAVTENGKMTQFNFEKPDSVSIVGNIYKGRVESILTGMQAAFINCGLGRNCYLSDSDGMPDSGKYDGENSAALPFPELEVGDEVMVQVTKAPVGKKGARVTLFPSIVGKHLIYMPKTPFVGVSRKIDDSELRRNLIYSADSLIDGGEGLIFRTAAPYARRSVMQAELNYLKKLYEGVQTAFKTSAAGTLLYADLNLPLRIMRDTLSYDIEKIVVGSPALEKHVSELMNFNAAENRRPVILHKGVRDLFEEYGLSEQVEEMLSTRVNLENGAYLVIEKTEALTVIDVNTGKFTGDYNLEQTVYQTNILAAREIARQVKLRNTGGIVVVDFIDMSDHAHRDSLVSELERALRLDSAKCAVSPMTKLGLVEFTRKRTGAEPFSLMTKPCKHCKTGYIKTAQYSAMCIRAKIQSLYAEGNKVIRIDLNDGLLDVLVNSSVADDLRPKLAGAEVYCVPHKSYSEEQLHFRCGDISPLPDNAIKLW